MSHRSNTHTVKLWARLWWMSLTGTFRRKIADRRLFSPSRDGAPKILCPENEKKEKSKMNRPGVKRKMFIDCQLLFDNELFWRENKELYSYESSRRLNKVDRQNLLRTMYRLYTLLAHWLHDGILFAILTERPYESMADLPLQSACLYTDGATAGRSGFPSPTFSRARDHTVTSLAPNWNSLYILKRHHGPSKSYTSYIVNRKHMERSSQE